MLSVVIETKNDEDPLARTLSSLVAAAVEGAVREVIVCDLGSTDRTHHVADHAGCTFLAQGGVAAGIRQAKCEWLLIIVPGARLLNGWADDVAEHMAHHTLPARFSRAKTDRSPFLTRVFSSKRTLADGLVITKRQAASLARNANNAEALAKGLAKKRLAAQIAVAARR